MDDTKDKEINPDGSTESTSWPLGASHSTNPYFLDRFTELDWDLPPHQTTFQLNPIGSPPLPPNCSSGSSRTNLAANGSFEPLPTRQGEPVSTSDSEDPPKNSTSTICKSTKTKGQKRMRQARFAFMTKSEVDHLEDGFRWRKYGQKSVKNSPFPRSYYRCTNGKCTVKKRVERSCEDPTIVITTYEGQHCHHSIGFPRGGLIDHEAPSFANNQTNNSSSPPNFHHSGMTLNQVANLQLSQVVPEATRASTTLPLSKPIPRRPPTNEGLLGDVVPGMSNQLP